LDDIGSILTGDREGCRLANERGRDRSTRASGKGGAHDEARVRTRRRTVQLARDAFRGGVAVMLGACLVACSASRQDGSAPISPDRTAEKSAVDGGVTSTSATGGGGAPSPPASTAAPSAVPVERPFAGSVAEATSLISAAVDKKQDDIASCIREFRFRKHIAHERVAVSFGIDQEGRLLGVTSKGKEDNELKRCVQNALVDAPFPRSHAGVITVTKTYEELVQ
jgi:hypothetical protein